MKKQKYKVGADVVVVKGDFNGYNGKIEDVTEAYGSKRYPEYKIRFNEPYAYATRFMREEEIRAMKEDGLIPVAGVGEPAEESAVGMGPDPRY